MFLDNSAAPDDTAAQHSALFAQLNQGEAITKGGQETSIDLHKHCTSIRSHIRWCVLPPGLKHVSDEQKTHKNPNLRSQGERTHQDSPAKRPSASVQAPAKKHSPVLELEGKKWRVVGASARPTAAHALCAWNDFYICQNTAIQSQKILYNAMHLTFSNHYPKPFSH